MFRQTQKRFKRTNQDVHHQDSYIFNLNIMRPVTNKHLPSSNNIKHQQMGSKSNKVRQEDKNKHKKRSIPQKSIKKPSPVNYQEDAFKILSLIISSQEYQHLNRHFNKAQQQQQSQKHHLKQQIKSDHLQILQKQRSLGELIKKRDHLMQQANSLDTYYNDLQLQNYQMRCQLQNKRGGRNQEIYEENYYESLPDINFDEMDYQELLELGERLGDANVGYQNKVIDKMPSTFYGCDEGQGEQKCCICCFQLQQGDQIYTTNCKHVHHKSCIQKWLKMKKICPLCRQQIILQ